MLPKLCFPVNLECLNQKKTPQHDSSIVSDVYQAQKRRKMNALYLVGLVCFDHSSRLDLNSISRTPVQTGKIRKY